MVSVCHPLVAALLISLPVPHAMGDCLERALPTRGLVKTWRLATQPWEAHKSALAAVLSQAAPVWLLVLWYLMMYHLQQHVGTMRRFLAFAPPEYVPFYLV